MKVQAINELRDHHDYNLKILLEIASLARSTYYYHKRNKINKDDSKIVKAIKDICLRHKLRYGYRRVTILLKRDYEMIVNHKKVLRIMKEQGLLSKVRKKKYKSYKGEVGVIADNVLERNFIASSLNEKWVSDITQFRVKGKKIYLSPIMDLYNREIISYTVSESPNVPLVMEMLEKAISKQDNIEKLIIHTDQGVQYQSKRYAKFLCDNGIIQSMSRKGNCYDNAVIENYFGILKSEFFYTEEFESIEDFKIKLSEYIKYYNEERISTKLKGMTPTEVRIHFLI